MWDSGDNDLKASIFKELKEIMHKEVKEGVMITYHQILNINKEKLFLKMKVLEFNSRKTNKKYNTGNLSTVDLKEQKNP